MLLMTPGPTRVPERVLAAGARPMLHHRDPAFSQILSSAIDKLGPLFGTSSDILPVHATGRGAMEGAICNLFSPGDQIVSFCNGHFGEMWSRIAEAFGITVHRICTDWNTSADPEALTKLFKSNPHVKAVMVAHSDTSTGALNDVAAIAATARELGLLVLVDVVSSLGGAAFEFDNWDIDIAITSSQKCLMSSPGLSFVAVSGRAWNQCQTSRLPRSYFDFVAIRKMLNRLKAETPGTTPVHLIMQIEAALSLIHDEGLENVFKRHQTMSQMVRDWVAENGLPMQCPNLTRYSPTLSAISIPSDMSVNEIRQGLREKGILVARGIGEFEETSIRIGHMGDIRPADVELTLRRLGEIIEQLR
jgi:aspartate aminotransferase-like enzyme